ncbi:MAG: ribosomal protein S18-alanine N-acetyltransferase [Proteobacteria bacterium]|nr:ribosomal protein S18-alanine N-acetyltransferase [Pseudomonadota bacterium]
MEISVRMAKPEDIDDIERIEKLSFSTPWSRNLLLEELFFPLGFNMVLSVDGSIEGFVLSWLINPEVHILNFAVSPAYRNRGLGKILMEAFIGETKKNGATKITLEVRAKNEGALKFYRSFNFTVKGIRRQYYQDTGEDAIIMWKEL